MPRSGFTDFLVNVIAGVLAFALLAALAWFLWNSGTLDALRALFR
jgi:hypothetical protein